MSAAPSTGGSEHALQQAAGRAASHLAALQSGEGLWPDLRTGGPYLDVLYALGAWFLGRKDHPFQPPRGEAWARRILSQQNADGGFPLWHGGPSDARYGIETYLALRLAGLPASAPGLRALGRGIAAAGGAGRNSSFLWIKLLWADAGRDTGLGSDAPERYFFLEYRRWQALTRQDLVCVAALAITAYLRGGWRAPASSSSPQLHAELPPAQQPAAEFRPGSLSSRLINSWARMAPRSLRDPIVFRAYDAMVEEALRWPVLPVALHAALAVRAAGGRGSAAQSRFERVISWLAPSSPAGVPRPCDLSTRTAALAARALARGAADCVLASTAAALLDRFLPSSQAGNGALRAGWTLGDLHAEPDPETTAFVLLALRQTGAADHAAVREACAALASAQRKDGGWSAGADEPSSSDVTGAAIEALIACGHPPSSAAIGRAVRFLEQAQHAEAWWRGARGICRLYGTAMALRGLRAAGVDDREAAVLRAGEWLRSIQNADGGWGEDPRAFDEAGFREAASTPAQTAWALLGLLAGGDSTSESVRRGFVWLAANQSADGGWAPMAPTMPGVAYAPYLMDPIGAAAWPLLAIHERLHGAASS